MPRPSAAHVHTTIKVTTETRDRLKALAEADDRTLGEEIDHLVSLAERHARMDAFAASVAATSPEDMSAYGAEIEFWDAVSGD